MAYIDLYFDSLEPAVRQNIVVYGKGTKNVANVISYFLMTSSDIPVLDLLFTKQSSSEDIYIGMQ